MKIVEFPFKFSNVTPVVAKLLRSLLAVFWNCAHSWVSRTGAAVCVYSEDVCFWSTNWYWNWANWHPAVDKNEFNSDANTIEKFQTLSKSSGRIVFRELSFRR